MDQYSVIFSRLINPRDTLPKKINLLHKSIHIFCKIFPFPVSHWRGRCWMSFSFYFLLLLSLTMEPLGLLGVSWVRAMLPSGWSKQVTWPEYWPLIGWLPPSRIVCSLCQVKGYIYNQRWIIFFLELILSNWFLGP